MQSIFSLFRSSSVVPEQHQVNFRNLYFDVTWFGLLNGSTLIFLAVYQARLGASAQQLGIFNAAPAIMNLLFTFPIGMLVRRFPTWKAAFTAFALMRTFYFLLILLPLMFFDQPQVQIWIIIGMVFVMNLPGTAAAIAGNTLFAEAVPGEWRGYVVGIRNALLSAVTMVVSLICGQILRVIAFPGGYPFVFGIGFLGAVMSTVHIFFIRPLNADSAEVLKAKADNAGLSIDLNPKILFSPFGKTIFFLFLFQFFAFAAMPIFPIYQVKALNLTDQMISVGTGVFWVMHFVGSIQVGRLSRILGYQRLSAIGMGIAGISALIFVYSYTEWIYWLCQIVGGLGWSMIGGGSVNYMLDKVPANERAVYLSWYNIAINAAMLAGAIVGPTLSGGLGIMTSLLIFGFFRSFVGYVIWRWG